MQDLAGIVLAAGISTRMGQDNKLFLPYKGKTILTHVLDNVLNSKIGGVICVSNERSFGQLSTLQNERLSVIENVNYMHGMTSSIQAGVAAAPSSCTGFMIFLGDQPELETDTINQLIDTFKDNLKADKKIIVAPVYQGKQGNPVIFSAFYRPNILSHTHPSGCKAIVEKHMDHVSLISVSTPAILRDVDTPDDYRDLLGQS